MPDIMTRARAALQVFRGGYPPWGAKAAPYIWPSWRTGTPQWQMVDVQAYVDEGFNQNALVYSAIMYKYRSQIAAPLRAYTGEMNKPEPLPLGRPLSDLVHRPNPYQSWPEFHGLNEIYLNVSGDAFVYVDRKGGKGVPQALWPLRPDRVFILADSSAKRLIGYVYVPEGATPENGRAILAKDMMHVKLPNPGDELEGLGNGLSPISPLARSGDVDNKVTQFLKVFFDKGTVMSGLLKYDNPLDPALVGQIRERWKDVYGGSENWAEIGILDRGGSYERISMTFEEMGFEGIDERNESRILGPFGVPPILIGSRLGLNRSTYANASLMRTQFWEDTMLPETRLFEKEYQYYLQDDGAFVMFDLSEVPALRKDVPALVDAWSKLVDRGVPKNLAADMVGLSVDGIPDGDTAYLIPGLMPVGEEPRLPEGEQPEAEEEDKGGPTSGNWGHGGLPMFHGGSSPGGGWQNAIDYAGIQYGEELAKNWQVGHYSSFYRQDVSYDMGEAILDYVGDGFEHINGYWRGKVIDPTMISEDYIRTTSDLIDGTIDTAPPLPGSTVVYRGWNATSETGKGLENLKPGDRITDLGYMSTTLHPEGYSDLMTGPGHTLRLVLPQGTEVLGIPDSWAAHPGEMEMLLPRQSSFKVIGVSKDDKGMNYVDAILTKAPGNTSPRSKSMKQKPDRASKFMWDWDDIIVTPADDKGGPGSGNWGHRGRPGLRGGSAPELQAVETEGSRKNNQALDEIFSDAAGGGDMAWIDADDDQRAEVKRILVEDLGDAAGLSYEDSNTFVKQWSHTSGDNDMRSLAIQKDAAEEFDEPLSEFTKSRIDALEATRTTEPGEYDFSLDEGEGLSALYPSDVQRNTLRQMHTITQEWLDYVVPGFDMNEGVTLYRGVKFSGDVRGKKGDLVDFKGNTLESWSLSPAVADRFARTARGGQRGYVFKAVVPAKKIICTALTGFGCLTEGEVVVLGSRGMAEIVELYT